MNINFYDGILSFNNLVGVFILWFYIYGIGIEYFKFKF